MMRTTEYKTREKIINEGATTSDDPRVDSPEIKVIYPPEEMDNQKDGATVETPSNNDQVEQPIEVEQQVDEQEEHVCKVSVQKAFEQNWLYFSIIAIALFGLGYALGKSKKA